MFFFFTVFDWIVVDRAGDGFPFANSSSNGLVVTSSVTVVYITAPPLFLGVQYRSYGQRLHVKVSAWRIPRRRLFVSEDYIYNSVADGKLRKT